MLLTVLCDPSAPGLAGSGRLHGKREALTGELALRVTLREVEAVGPAP